MKKVLLVFSFLIIAAVTVSAADDKPNITVLDFSVDQISKTEMRSIVNILSSSLFKTGKFTVIDVSQRETILNELEFSMSGCTDESCYLEIGKILSAEGIVVGNIGKVGSRYVLTAKLIQTETGATMSTYDGIYKDLDLLLDDIENVSEELGAPFGNQPAPKPEVTQKAEVPAAPPEQIETVPQAITPAEPIDINIPATTALVGGIGCLGAGGFFLAVSLPLFIEYLSAQQAYDSASDAATAASLYIEAESARTAAIDGNVNLNLPLGIGLSAAGIGLGILSVLLFAEDGPAEDSPVNAAMYPVQGGVALSFQVKY